MIVAYLVGQCSGTHILHTDACVLLAVQQRRFTCTSNLLQNTTAFGHVCSLCLEEDVLFDYARAIHDQLCKEGGGKGIG